MTLQFWAEFLVSRFFFIVPMAVSLAVWWWVQRWMDISAGIKFREVWDEIKGKDNEPGNQAVAHYRGLRAIAVAVVVAGVAIAGAIAADLT